MVRLTYAQQVANLEAAINIAIAAVKQYTPLEFAEHHTASFVSSYESLKQDLLWPEAVYRNVASLRYLQQSVFTYFHESKGPTVDYFWFQIKSQNLPYHRENRMLNILEKGRITSRIEYEFVVDALMPYQQEGLITEKQVDVLNQMIEEFEGL